MAKAPSPGKCVHCLKEPVELTWDHVFPKSWYPNTTPPNLSKWKIPACLSCNREYGKIEEDLLIRLALCVNKNLAEASGIATSVLRALDPTQAKDDRDRKYRQGKRDAILNEVESNMSLTNAVYYPGLDEKWGRTPDKQTKLSFPPNSIARLVEKVVRCIVYIVDEKFIEPPYVVHPYVVSNEEWFAFTSRLLLSAKTHENGPGIKIYRARAEDDSGTSGFSIEIWGQFRMLAFTENTKTSPPIIEK